MTKYLCRVWMWLLISLPVYASSTQDELANCQYLAAASLEHCLKSLSADCWQHSKNEYERCLSKTHASLDDSLHKKEKQLEQGSKRLPPLQQDIINAIEVYHQLSDITYDYRTLKDGKTHILITDYAGESINSATLVDGQLSRPQFSTCGQATDVRGKVGYVKSIQGKYSDELVTYAWTPMGGSGISECWLTLYDANCDTIASLFSSNDFSAKLPITIEHGSDFTKAEITAIPQEVLMWMRDFLVSLGYYETDTENGVFSGLSAQP